MPEYQIFGGILRSQLDFPGLAPSKSGTPTWTLSRVDSIGEVTAVVAVGRERVEEGIEVTLARHDDGLRLTFDDTGVFDVLDGGRSIVWAAPEAPNLDAVRKDLLGRVFAVALDQQGIVTLHGSAVALGDVAVAFLAPKFHGKSTTASALVNAGGRLLADDLVPVTTGGWPMVLPSVPVVQLWKDSADRVAGGTAPVSADQSAPKLQVAWVASERNAVVPVPLAAVYLLAPVPAEPPGSVKRHRVTGVESALALLGQTKVGALLGVERRSALLQILADISNQVPVYRLEIPRDFDRIEELTSSLLKWHAQASVAEPTGGGGS